MDLAEHGVYLFETEMCVWNNSLNEKKKFLTCLKYIMGLNEDT